MAVVGRVLVAVGVAACCVPVAAVQAVHPARLRRWRASTARREEVISWTFRSTLGVVSDRELHGGAVRFREDGRWGRWHVLEDDGVQTPGSWASGLVSGGDADAFEVGGLGRGRRARAIMINTTDGLAESSASSVRMRRQTAIVTRCKWVPTSR